MSKSVKTKLSIVVCIMVLCGWIVAIGVSHAAKVGDPDQIWGKPTGVIKTASGSEMKYYALERCDYKCFRVFEIGSDGRIIDKGLSPTMP
jgi:hypothetical protein